MQLLSDWKWIVRRAWSVRFGAAAAVLSGIEVVLPMFPDLMPRGVFALASFAATGAALIARLVAQARPE